jgi:hypothetical protein
MNAALI